MTAFKASEKEIPKDIMGKSSRKSLIFFKARKIGQTKVSLLIAEIGITENHVPTKILEPRKAVLPLSCSVLSNIRRPVRQLALLGLSHYLGGTETLMSRSRYILLAHFEK